MPQNEILKPSQNNFARQPRNIQRDRQGNEEAWLGMKTPMVRGRLWPKRGGEFSELAFFYKAASLGFGVANPWGDSEPYDFILDSGQRLWRVQLKSASHHFNRRYDVHAKRGKDEKVMYRRADIDILSRLPHSHRRLVCSPAGKDREESALFLSVRRRPPCTARGISRSLEPYGPATSDASFLSGCLQNGRARPGYLNPRFL